MSTDDVGRANLATITCDPRPQLPDGFKRNSTRVGTLLGACAQAPTRPHCDDGCAGGGDPPAGPLSRVLARARVSEFPPPRKEFR